jgi:hypothetical protein
LVDDAFDFDAEAFQFNKVAGRGHGAFLLLEGAETRGKTFGFKN